MNLRRKEASITGAAATPARVLLAWAAALWMACFAVSAQAAPAQSAPAASPSASAAALTQRCIGCHDDPEIKSDDGTRSMTVLADDYRRSAHRKLDCGECHTAALTIRHPRNPLGPVDPKACQECHADEFKAVAGSVHGRRAATEKAIRDCTSCHGGLHRALKDGAPDSPMSPVQQIRTCGKCHEEMMANYESSEHARALLKLGLTENAPSCSSCHGTHEIRPRADAAASTNRARVPETCGKCHDGVLREWRESAHAPPEQAAGAGGRRGQVCTTCHSSHAIKRQDSALVRTQVADRCGGCHEDVNASFRDSFHGKATLLRDTTAAVCADCHTPHHNLPASDPRSSVHPDNLAKTCGACHPGVSASFLTFDPHADPTNPDRNLYVFLAWLGMTGVLLSVFDFFAVHDLLWLQRSLVGKLRGEFGAAHHRTGPHVRRFSSGQIALHVTIVTSFLLLAATGLPLKFAEAPWAPGLMALLGGRPVAGVLHRFAAAVTFGYFAWHLGTLAWGWFVRKERGYFWGPRSMVPQPRDVVELWTMLKYFLYIGPRPKFDRFTYWEKFDYIGVFWGVAVIGISGLFLWMPGLVTRFLPGWVLNVAYVIHSDEALLATGFIFVFHFIHTHLRPESFPMDTVVFTGRVPLEAFKEERALEYQTLVAQGRLESRLAPAPTPGEMRVAYVFGFITLATGIVLAVFIFWGLLQSMHP